MYSAQSRYTIWAICAVVGLFSSITLLTAPLRSLGAQTIQTVRVSQNYVGRVTAYQGYLPDHRPVLVDKKTYRQIQSSATGVTKPVYQRADDGQLVLKSQRFDPVWLVIFAVSLFLAFGTLSRIFYHRRIKKASSTEQRQVYRNRLAQLRNGLFIGLVGALGFFGYLNYLQPIIYDAQQANSGLSVPAKIVQRRQVVYGRSASRPDTTALLTIQFKNKNGLTQEVVRKVAANVYQRKATTVQVTPYTNGSGGVRLLEFGTILPLVGPNLDFIFVIGTLFVLLMLPLFTSRLLRIPKGRRGKTYLVSLLVLILVLLGSSVLYGELTLLVPYKLKTAMAAVKITQKGYFCSCGVPLQ
ncbi:hypothetical protein [Loigolactobacillus backii]|uniref:Uncharacterized protein n=1 Tax=Loigolactobacillus backii TaxID=375175 RepID=A0A192H0C6_9LACO|nr:hypothetical protein [Loigolactobacillus backii]ANK61416.1 hypothetical protein AYR53_00770 [Loigolactobacillus backii]ANK69384.1 hypothetical protein AYR56_03945 [Loigolactobacillus backii]MDA5388936.1 hypothetical protein [Loigolactobacillus backii]MDA5391440.1 hypothetical protein [Loigolactobacillus backii]PIO84120.1 hypothetical protein BSQ39_11395 [Loigolactobacillus backii]